MSKKHHTSVVIEFGHPEDANKALDFGLTWLGQMKTCESYDRTMRLLQCFRCYKYGHTGTRCRAPIQCGKCSGSHDKEECTESTKKCALCGQGHYAWSDNCTFRTKERARLAAHRKVYEYPNPPTRKQLIKTGRDTQNAGTPKVLEIQGAGIFAI